MCVSDVCELESQNGYHWLVLRYKSHIPKRQFYRNMAIGGSCQKENTKKEGDMILCDISYLSIDNVRTIDYNRQYK